MMESDWGIIMHRVLNTQLSWTQQDMVMVLRPLFGYWSCYPDDPRTHHRYKINYSHFTLQNFTAKIKSTN
jgi:hypothetical protein